MHSEQRGSMRFVRRALGLIYVYEVGVAAAAAEAAAAAGRECDNARRMLACCVSPCHAGNFFRKTSDGLLTQMTLSRFRRRDHDKTALAACAPGARG